MGMVSRKVLLITILSICISDIYAQDRLRQPMFRDLEVTNSVSHSKGDSIYNFHVRLMKGNDASQDDKRYYWFHQGEVKSTVGNHAGSVLHGAFEKFDRKGNLIEKGDFSNGLKDGSWMTWHDNGNVASMYSWNDGWRSGDFKEFNREGSLRIKGSYRNDKLHGTVYYYTPAGAVVREERYRYGQLMKEKGKKTVKDRKKPDGSQTPEEEKPQNEKRRGKKKETLTEPLPQTEPDKKNSGRKTKKEQATESVSPLQHEPSAVSPDKKAKKTKPDKVRKKKKDNPTTTDQPVPGTQ